MPQVLKNIGLALLCATALLIAGVCLLIVSSIPGNIRKDREYEHKLRPAIVWVESFQKKNHRLPSDAEFERGTGADPGLEDLVTIDSEDEAWMKHGGKTKNDFAVRVWRGENWTYYFSWNKEFEVVEPPPIM